MLEVDAPKTTTPRDDWSLIRLLQGLAVNGGGIFRVSQKACGERVAADVGLSNHAKVKRSAKVTRLSVKSVGKEQQSSLVIRGLSPHPFPLPQGEREVLVCSLSLDGRG
jgi:hypothetical protein